MSSIPFGVWFGSAIVLLGAWGKDVRGVVIGAVVIAATAALVRRRDLGRDPEDPPAR